MLHTKLRRFIALTAALLTIVPQLLLAGDRLEVQAGGITTVDPSNNPDAPETVEGQSPEAIVLKVIPIQGRLTDSDGLPISGSRQLGMILYDASVGGIVICGDTDTVVPENGLFQTYMDFCTADGINGRQLYLAVQIIGEPSAMTPRIPIYPVPYAFSLVEGAVVGTLKTTKTNEVVVSPLSMVRPAGGFAAFTPMSNGFMAVEATAVGGSYGYVPIDIPSVIFGTRQMLQSVRVCYISTSASNSIQATQVVMLDDAGSYTNLVSETGTTRNSTVWTCYTVTDASPAQVTGSLYLRFQFSFAAPASVIGIGKITLTFVEE